MIDIVIVNWNSGLQLSEAVLSIAKFHHNLVSNVVVIDNASSDGSIAHLESLLSLPFQLHVILNARNIGFGAACNQGAEISNSKYVLFLNPDARLFQESLSVPFNYMESKQSAKVAVVGIQLVNEDDMVSRSCARFPKLSIFIAQALGVNRIRRLCHWTQTMVEWDHCNTGKVDQVMGAFFFVRRSVFESVGGFDERFYVYFEEVDFSFRISQLGWHSVYIAESQAFHAGGGTSRNVKAHRLFYSLRSRVLYGFKHFSPWQAWALVFLTSVVEPVSRAVFSLVRGGLGDFHNTIKGFMMLYRSFPEILRKAR